MKAEYILKERLQQLVAGAKVRAALFYTFNFDPRFFENYVMPVLVPEEEFHNNAILNNVQWRKLYKDGQVPEITVYCDQYAKSLEAGPMLPYKVVQVNMPSLGKNKGNFHPKQSFILLEANGERSLVMVTGSNNITQGGWCENREGISELVLSPSGFFPPEFKMLVQAFINSVSESYNPKGSEAEALIRQFLNKHGTTSRKKIGFYDSFQGSFREFLENKVFAGDDIRMVEVMSPFICENTSLVDFLRQKGVEVRLEVPVRDGYCLVEEQVYERYSAAGATWWQAVPEGKGISERHSHSKVYRFYGPGQAYTFVGSVNFTAPGWCGVPARMREVYNIESGVLYQEKVESPVYLLKNKLKELPKFLPVIGGDPETWTERADAPAISFTINWSTKVLSWKAGGKVTACSLALPMGTLVEIDGPGEVLLNNLERGAEILVALSRKSILEVRQISGNEVRTHYYYPDQLGFEQKPIEYRLSATDILDAWEQLKADDQAAKEWLVTRLEQLTAIAQDESGNIIQQVSENKSLLNEMARHLYGLIQLEQYLFNEAMLKGKGMARMHAKKLGYYLTHEGVDTLISYLRDLETLHDQQRLIGGYYWLLLSIIQKKFYQNRQVRFFLREGAEDDQRRKIAQAVNAVSGTIDEKLRKLINDLGVEKKKLDWALECLNYAFD